MEYRITGLAGSTLFESLLDAGLPVESPCGGAGTCGKCRVLALSADLEPSPENPGNSGNTGNDSAAGWRKVLACRTRFIRDGSALVDIVEKTMRIVDHSDLSVPEGKPAVALVDAALPEPTLENAVSELERLQAASGTAASDDAVVSSLRVPRELAARIESGATGTREFRLVVQEGGHLSFAAEDDCPALVVAVDIGTTSVAVRLIDAQDGRILASGARINVQKWAGADVIARIGACVDAQGFARLTSGISGQLGKMILSLVKDADRAARSVQRIVIAGNPTMLHLLAGVDPAGIARSPFVPVFTSAFDLAPADSPLGDIFGSDTRTILIPGVSAYVGADLVAGALACGLGPAARMQGREAENPDGGEREFSNREPALLLDLGTNGEIMLFSGKKAWCTSAAAGPAFEGASIRFGSPSVPGAIDHVWLADGKIAITVMGDGVATGICGSGILDAVAVLLDSGAMDETGRIYPESAAAPERFAMFEGKPAVIIDADSGIFLTQDDIRQVQLAKAAVAAGVDILLAQAGLTAREVRTIYLAGGFGSRLNPDSALRIGLLHKDFSRRVVAVGNSSLAGAVIVALRAGSLGICTRIARECRAIELSGRGDFVAAFSEAMFFPEI